MRDLSNDTSLLSLNTATVREQWNLRECIEGCARHGIGAIAPWRDKLQECGVQEAATMIADNGLRVSSLCRGGFFTADDKLNLEDNKKAVDEAVAIGAECLILVTGGLRSGSKDLSEARKIVTEGVSQLLDYALSCNMPLALEPLHPMYAADRSCVNTLRQAVDICENFGKGIGVAIDAYHVWWDPQLATHVERAGKMNCILGYHVCDWLVPTDDLLLDRGMPGDGIIELRKIREMVEGTGYEGCIEVEVFSEKNWWKRDPDEVLKTCIERHQTVV